MWASLAICYSTVRISRLRSALKLSSNVNSARLNHQPPFGSCHALTSMPLNEKILTYLLLGWQRYQLVNISSGAMNARGPFEVKWRGCVFRFKRAELKFRSPCQIAESSASRQNMMACRNLFLISCQRFPGRSRQIFAVVLQSGSQNLVSVVVSIKIIYPLCIIIQTYPRLRIT